MDLFSDRPRPRLLRAVRRAFYAAAAAWLWFWLSPVEGASPQWIVALAGPIALLVVYLLIRRVAYADDEFDSLA